MLWATFRLQKFRSPATFRQCAPEATEFGEITQNKGHYAIQGHDFGTNRKLIYDFLLVINKTYLLSFQLNSYLLSFQLNRELRTQSELNNIHRLAEANNLKANPSKYAEIIFANGRRRTKQQISRRICRPGITKVTTIKILGVTFTNSLSVAEHVHNVISSCGRVTSKHCNGKTVN